MAKDEVRAYYAHFAEKEWDRLTDPQADGVVEYALTTHTLAAYLPPASRVLDVGGGPGRYSLWLAEQGHRVVLADLSPTQLALAREKVASSSVAARIEEIVEADACDLSRWPEGVFDAVLALGPFYHLTTPTEREQAATEVARVVRPGGLVFIALIPRLAFLRRRLALPDERHQLADPTFVARVLEEGMFFNDVPGRFTSAYGVRPEEVAPFFARYGFQALALLADVGLSMGLGGALAEMAATDPEGYRTALEVVLRTAHDPSILGLSNHLLYVGQRSEMGQR